jgi:hypothetical protein
MGARTLQCDLCPAPAMAFLPGSEPAVCDLFALTRGEKRRAWCLRCWKLRFRVAEEAA